MDEQRYKKIRDFFLNSIPHVAELNMQIEQMDKGYVELSQPYQVFMLGNIASGFLHGGVITSLIDTASGMAVCTLIAETERIATLDLRIDSLRPALAEHTLYATAECYRVTSQIIFLRAHAYQQSKDEPVSTALLTFIRMQRENTVLESNKHAK